MREIVVDVLAFVALELECGVPDPEPLGEQLLPGPHPVYRLHFLRDGLANYLCEKVDICL